MMQPVSPIVNKYQFLKHIFIFHFGKIFKFVVGMFITPQFAWGHILLIQQIPMKIAVSLVKNT